MLTDKVKVEAFLNKYFHIYGNYTISDEGVIDVDGDIELKYEQFNHDGLTELPIQFGHIIGRFKFENSNIKSLKGFPHTVDGFCSVRSSKNLKSLEFSPKCKWFYCSGCDLLESFDFLNCNECYCYHLNLKRFGTNFITKEFSFTQLPTPTADEMRIFIQLNPEFVTEQQAPWITIIKDYYKNKDIFRAAQEFEALYNESLIKPENRIEIINSDLTMSNAISLHSYGI